MGNGVSEALKIKLFMEGNGSEREDFPSNLTFEFCQGKMNLLTCACDGREVEPTPAVIYGRS